MKAVPPLAAAAIALLVAAPSLANGFAYDDLPIIVNNPRVTEPHSLWWHLHQGYWPSLLYRPLTIWFFSLQWRVGNGSPWVFHAVNAVLLAVNTTLVYRLARAWFPPAIAVGAAALFAVHPVHVEAVANVVGQSELLASLGVLAAVVLYVESTPAGPSPFRRGMIALAGACAALSKENAFALPGLLVVAALLVPPEQPLGERWRALKPTLLLVLIAFLGLLSLRAAVLGGAVGEEPAVALRGLSAVERSAAMLGVVPEWLRLLLWPAHLQSEYGPPLLGLPRLGARQWVGLLVLTSTASLAWWCRRRIPAVMLGTLWAAVALAPVSNVLVPTGIVLAERTLFLASVGAVIAVAGLGQQLMRLTPKRAVRTAAGVATVTLVLLGAWRSVTRAGVWRSNQTVFTVGVVDAPQSYRAWRMLALHMQSEGRWGAAEEAFRRSLRLWDRDPSVHEGLGLTLVQQGRCADAIPILRQGIVLDSRRSMGSARLYFCQRKLGDWASARATAAGALARGDSSFVPLLRAADSAINAAAMRPSGPTPGTTGRGERRAK